MKSLKSLQIMVFFFTAIF